jgi:hypothetical protein
MASYAKKSIATLFAGTVLAVGIASPASAQSTKQDGLVNVNVGDVTILEDVNIAAAVDVVAQLCGIDLDVLANVQLLTEAATAVDNTSRSYTVCRNEDGKVKFTQN